MRYALGFLIACGTPAGAPGPTDAPPGIPADDDRLLPLAVDRVWTYDVTSTYPSCPGGVREQRVLGTETIEDRETFRVLGFCGVEGST
ncbi:MAG: hypothetical protein H0V17_16040, partial [Deltaproteobacteria bacterium]|nr:hypothetical protein [Deltaproteobacteria bacterium]